MSLAKEQLLQLMQYADGELDGVGHEEAHEAVVVLLKANAEARAFLDEMDLLGDATRAAEPYALPDSLSSFDVADAIMAGVEEHEQKQAVTAQLRGKNAVAARSAAKSGKAAEEVSAGAGVSSLEVAREKRRRLGVIVATGLALAAGIALVMRTHPSEDPLKSASLKPLTSTSVPALTPSGNVPPLAQTSEAALAAANSVNVKGDKGAEQGVEVNISDSPQSGVSVFYLPGSDVASASAVVWIDESSGGKQ
jgi:hypothetical protein